MRKKIIKTFGFIILSNVPLMTMATSSSSASSSETSILQITQTFKTKLRTKFVNNWVTETQESSNSNIIDGYGGMIFEDSRENLWAMGGRTPLQKYDYENNRWNIDNKKIRGGMIFEDSQGNLWAMGYKSSLYKYNYNTKIWSIAGEKSNINDGFGGVIFEDSRGNLWSMGSGTPLQKYDYSNNNWGASSGNNITNGKGGVIFEDSRGNLWAMGNGTPLQKYDYSTNNWVATSGSNITNGWGGVIFEDSKGNLWAAGKTILGKITPLQKYNYKTKSWNVNNIDNKKIFPTNRGIFEDSSGDLWALEGWNRLKKYDYKTKSWNVFYENSNINDGREGIIFEDSRGNLWSMGNGTLLQKYDYSNNNWDIPSSSNITNGSGGIIFEDSKGNLWSMGNDTPLQKLTSQVVPNVSDQKTKNFNITFTTRINADGRIAVLIKGYRKYTSNKFTHLRYKKKNKTDWKIVKDKIMILDNADYEFKWVIGTDERIASDSKMPVSFNVKNDGSIKKNIINTTNLTREFFSLIGTNDNGTISIQSSDLPSQVEPRYYVGLKPNPNNNEYTKVVPSNLSNDNKIKIKFFIKNENINTHKFATDFNNTPIEITVTDLPEGIPVPTTHLKKESFFITGLNGVGTIKLKKGITLPSQIEVKYYVGTASNPNDSDYTNKVPNKLSNGKKVWIKFFIKDQNINTHKFPNNFVNTPIEIKVSGLNNKSSNKENSGATIGIIAGSIVGTLTLGILAYYLIRSKKKKTK